MIIALMGNDGSGKSTMATLLAQRLEARGERVHRTMEFDYPVLRGVRKLKGRRLAQERSEVQAGRSATSARYLPYLMLVSTALQTLAMRVRYRNAYVVKDRCLYDYLATWRELGVSSRAVEFLYGRAPRPDLTVLLSATPETQFSRRDPARDAGTKPFEFYERKTAIYEDIYSKSCVTRVSSEGERDDTLAKLSALIDLKERLSALRVVALSGLDGAGKSTTVEHFGELLERLNVPHAQVHFYYNYVVLKALRRVKKSRPVDEKVVHAKSIEKERRHKAEGKGRLWAIGVLADAACQYWFVRLTRFRRLVVFDRFFHDYFVSFDFLNVDYNRSLLNRLIPRADRHFLQIADYELLHSRKPEHTIEFFAQCFDRYIELADERDLIILDSTSLDADQITQRLLASV